MYRRLAPAISLHQAAEGSPTLGGLMARARDSAERLKAVEGLIPPAMRGAVQAGAGRGRRVVPAGQRQRRSRQAAATRADACYAAQEQGLGCGDDPHQGAHGPLIDRLAF
jgi:pyruvate carboxylase